jgi:thiamine pyrophosphate-dependent acetolactate synthase large subunit-like protein
MGQFNPVNNVTISFSRDTAYRQIYVSEKREWKRPIFQRKTLYHHQKVVAFTTMLQEVNRPIILLGH